MAGMRTKLLFVVIFVIGVISGYVVFTDTDGDGITTIDEFREYDTNPLLQDTDGDGLKDGTEIRQTGSNPNNKDTDGDGLIDGDEVLEYDSSPTSIDSDNDTLTDSEEVQIGTDPSHWDTDRDLIRDDFEVEGETASGASIQSSHPLRKDIFLQVNYAANVDPLTEREKGLLRGIWKSIPVRNPDGSRGIRLHIDDQPPGGGSVNESIVYRTRSAEELRSEMQRDSEDMLRRYYAGNSENLGDVLPPERRCVYHQMVLVQIGSNVTVTNGNARTPGRFSFLVGDVEGEENPLIGAQINDRISTMTHELLHNVLGRLNKDSRAPGSESHSRYQGIMAQHEKNRSASVSDAIVQELQQNGFEEDSGCG